jgi:hypothetical protein
MKTVSPFKHVILRERIVLQKCVFSKRFGKRGSLPDDIRLLIARANTALFNAESPNERRSGGAHTGRASLAG